MEWMKKSYSNTLGFTPYYSTFTDNNEKKGNIAADKKEEGEKKDEATKRQEKIDEILKKGDEMVKEITDSIKKPDIVVFKVKGDKAYYEQLYENDPLTTITKKLAKNLNDKEDTAVIELEIPDDGDLKSHNERISYIKKVNPNLRVAATLDKKEGYDEKTGLWNPEKSRKYWENADIIIIEDYFSSPSNLEKSIARFKEETKGGKQVWVRVVTGSKRINEKGIKSLEAEVEEYEKIVEVVHKYADGCLANDGNGIWLYSDESYDKKERLDTTKMLYKRFRGIKIDKN